MSVGSTELTQERRRRLPAPKRRMIETERLILRVPELADAPAVRELITDPVAMEFIGGVHPQAASDPEFVVRRWLERWDDNGCGPFSIVRREDGRWLGRSGLLIWDGFAPANIRSQRLAERLGATPGETVELFDNGPHVLWEHPR